MSSNGFGRPLDAKQKVFYYIADCPIYKFSLIKAVFHRISENLLLISLLITEISKQDSIKLEISEDRNHIMLL